LTDSLAKIGFSPAIQQKLAETETRHAQLKAELADLEGELDDIPVLPPIEELKKKAREAISRMNFDDPSFGRLMTTLVPRLVVFPYRLLDGGAVVLRAQATINLAPLTPRNTAISIGDLITRTVTIDLFDSPQRVTFRERVVGLRQEGLTEREVAANLGLTVTAAQRAMSLHRMMVEAVVSDPYRRLTAPPDGDSKFRRHFHPRYEFRPLPDCPTPPADAA
jgi:hypothetical protein